MFHSAARASNRPNSGPTADEGIDSLRVAELLARCLSIPSYSFEDRARMDAETFRSLHRLLEADFPLVHRHLQRETVNDLSLLYRWQGSDTSLDPILLMSHLDVVPVEEQSRSAWTFPGDRGTLAEGFVWGRGALDVKCGVIAILAAIESLVAKGCAPARTVYLAFGHDEEVGGEQGNAAIARELANNGIRLSLVLDEGGAILDGILPGLTRPVAFVAVAEKRAAHLRLTARGEGGHGSVPGRSAIVNLSEAILRLDHRPMPARLTEAVEQMFDCLAPELPFVQRLVIKHRGMFRGLLQRRLARNAATDAVVRSTLNVTQVHSGTAQNQNAASAEATINVRLLPGTTAADACEHVRRVTDDLRLADGRPAVECHVAREIRREHISPIQCREFHTLQQTIHDVFPNVAVVPGLTAVSTDSRWYYDLTDNVFRFIPMRLKPHDVSRIHGVDERIAVDNLGEITRFYEQLLLNSTSESTPTLGESDPQT